jgi:hypothetical protein
VLALRNPWQAWLRSPSSGQQPRLCCQRLQGRPLIWHISQSQAFRGPRNGTGTKTSNPRYPIAQFDATLLSAVVQESEEDLPYSSFIIIIIIIIVLLPSPPPSFLPPALHCTRIHLPPAKSIRAQSCNSYSHAHFHARHPSTSTCLSTTPISSLLHIRTAPAHS